MNNRIAAALAVVLATPFALSGCVAAPDFHTVVPAAVVASNPVIEDAFTATSTGIAGVGVWVRVYVTSTEHDDLVRVIDSALEATLAASPVRPVSVRLDVAASPMPGEPNMSQPNISIEDAARELDLYDGHLSDDTISGTIDFFEERYGTWEELRQ
ncbi:hypothetical protein [Cryobacterium sp. BB736]|uniref:hypothetical protein n=1 Tax=Cryobacterium sp. BB736 TaxID=2746963 RepID=UPI0018750746|nr:hypothetical protein [Cryobacterium sp. BB736]